MCCHFSPQLFTFYTVTAGHLELNYFCGLVSFSTSYEHEYTRCCTQISNNETVLTFFTERKEDLLQWKESIEDAIMYVLVFALCQCVYYTYVHRNLKAAYGSLTISPNNSNSERVGHHTPNSHDSRGGLTATYTTLVSFHS